jgi:hypothetical protein
LLKAFDNGIGIQFKALYTFKVPSSDPFTRPNFVAVYITAFWLQMQKIYDLRFSQSWVKRLRTCLTKGGGIVHFPDLCPIHSMNFSTMVCFYCALNVAIYIFLEKKVMDSLGIRQGILYFQNWCHYPRYASRDNGLSKSLYTIHTLCMPLHMCMYIYIYTYIYINTYVMTYILRVLYTNI